MSNPYSSVDVTNYNDAAPSDDGAQTETNRVKWSKIKDELADPLKTAIEAVDTAVNAAVAKMPGGAGVSSQSAGYSMGASDQGKIIRVTSAGTVTTADAAAVGAPFSCFVMNASSGTVVLDGHGSQTVDGQASINLPSGAGVLIDTDGTNWFTAGRGVALKADSFISSFPMFYYSANLTLSNNATDADNDIDISAFAVRDFANTINMVSSAITKRFDASWALGTGNGGFPTALTRTANTWYRVFAVDTTSGAIDVGFDTSATAANLLADTGGTKYRRIGWIKTRPAATTLQKFFNVGDYFAIDDAYNIIDEETTAIGNDPTNDTISLNVPPERILAHVYIEILKNSGLTSVYHGDQTYVNPNTNTAQARSGRDFLNDGSDITQMHELIRLTNSSGQIKWRTSGTNVTGACRTIGYWDKRNS